ncbi:hypothetical protein ACFU6K_03110 [Kitasatospora sp. NPDC057512]|uniref:hypothetical protein n=1 Tax=Kitasatospora sp. NPDC057512 TaxID=3346154 RepID=UPI003693419E
MHHRFVERRVGDAARSSPLLSTPLDLDLLRRALKYDGGLGFAALLVIGLFDLIFLSAVFAGWKGACTAGGLLPSDGGNLAACPTHHEKVSVGLVVLIFSLVLWAASVTRNARTGVRVQSCYQALIPALEVLGACGQVWLLGGHDAAAELSKKAEMLGQAVVDGSGHAASDYGSRSATRAATREHARRVAALLERTADELLPDRERATASLAVYAAAIAHQTADGRFTNLLGPIGQPPELPPAAPESPDRTDGRRLAVAAMMALVLTALIAWGIGYLGLPAYVDAPLATLSVPLVAFLFLAYRYGLAEALRLTATLRSVRNGDSTPAPQVASSDGADRNQSVAQQTPSESSESNDSQPADMARGSASTA